MAWYNPISWFKEERLDEEIKSFKNKSKVETFGKNTSGEGISDAIYDLSINGFDASRSSTGSFNYFNRRYIDYEYNNWLHRIKEYRRMAEMPEINDVIEDAVNESTQEDENGNIFTLKILDNDIESNENMRNNIINEFNELFYKKLKIQNYIWDYIRTYYIDGCLFFERIINESRHKDGIVKIKKLPTESMDFLLNPQTGHIEWVFQYLEPGKKTIVNIEEARKDDKVIVFHPNQVSVVDYGVYGNTRRDIIGYLDKVKQPFNQLRMLETSLVIYRVIRAPERLIFKIDVGNMPPDKARRFVQKQKEEMSQTKMYDADSGTFVNQNDVSSVLENFFLPQSSDGRGSDISSIGGSFDAFSQLDDIYYFQRKLYRALKYPMSRVQNQQENRSQDILFGGNRVGEISRDEIKWAKFLERQQRKFCDAFLELFLIHLEFKGIKKQYGLNNSNIEIEMIVPNKYDKQMEQNFLETRIQNYSSLSQNEEFSKTFLMKKYLNFTDEEIKENRDGFKEDKKLQHSEDLMRGGRGGFSNF